MECGADRQYVGFGGRKTMQRRKEGLGWKKDREVRGKDEEGRGGGEKGPGSDDGARGRGGGGGERMVMMIG